MTNQWELQFEKLSVNDGLCHSSVYCILQDKNGFMWFGTRYGISKYDGYSFKSYFTMSNSSIEKSVIGIFSSYEDSNGDIWFGSWDGDLIRYNNEEDNLEYFIIPLTEDVFRNRIYFLYDDNFGYLWIGTTKKGLFKFNKFSKEFSYINFKWDGSNINSVPGIAIINDIELALLVKDTLTIYNIQNGMSEVLYIKLNVQKNVLNKYFQIFKISSSELILETTSGLMIYNAYTKEIINYDILFPDEMISTSDIHYMCSDNLENIWLSLKKGGIFRKDKNSRIAINVSGEFGNEFGIGKNEVFEIYNDKSGVIWISLLGSGLYKVDTTRKKFDRLNPIIKMYPNRTHVYILHVDPKNNLFIGTRNNGLLRYNLKTNQIIQFKTSTINEDCLSSQLIMSLFLDRENNFWVGTGSNGLFKYNAEKDEFKHLNLVDINNRINKICEYFDNEIHYLLLISNEKGITRLNTKNLETSNFTDCYEIFPDVKFNKISDIHLDKNNNLWLTFFEITGIYKISFINQTYVKYFPGSGYNGKFNKINEDENCNLWFCGDGILVKYSFDDELFIEYHIETEGNKRIYDIVEDNEGKIWFSTLKALHKMDPFNNEIRKYDHNDGLLNEEFIVPPLCKDNNGLIYLGGTNGIDYFNPAEIKDNPYIPHVVLTDFEIFNKTINGSYENPFLKKNITYADKINLTYRESVFSFTFASLVYNRPRQNQYAYKLDGFDKDWTYSSTRRRATYTNLDPGEYVFRVKGSNNDGVWNEEGTSIKINISPPFWKTRWFKGLGILGTAAATGYSINQRFEKIKKEKRLQEDFSRKLIESQENDRKRIASELHDSLGQGLAVIKNKALLSMKKVGDEKIKEQMNEISEITTTAINEVKEISYNLRPYELDRVGLIRTLQSLVDRASKTTNIKFKCDIDNIDKLFNPEVEINIYRILQECLTNIIKHSEATKVSVYLKKHSENISIFISDNGKGFDVNKKFSNSERMGFGLRGIPERVKLFGGIYKIESEPGKGTKIKILIPI